MSIMTLIEDILAGKISFEQATDEFRRQCVEAALVLTGGNKSAAAPLLGIHRNTLMALLRPNDAPRHPKRFEKWRGADAVLSRTNRRRG